MALHRDIYWVGRQWAVTGLGMQAIDQKLRGKFDIDVSRLWEEDLPEILRAEKWFNPEDFSKGLVLARARYPQPPGQPAPKSAAAPVAPPPPLAVPASIVVPAPVAAPVQVAAPPPASVPAPVSVPAPLAAPMQITVPAPKTAPLAPDSGSVEPPKPALQELHMRIESCPAKFVRPWRIRLRPNGIAVEQDN
jgi:hypothetical protein